MTKHTINKLILNAMYNLRDPTNRPRYDSAPQFENVDYVNIA